MHPVTATGRSIDLASRKRPEAKAGAPGRALVLVQPPASPTSAPAERPTGHNPLSRPSAAFLAQLIAARHNLPQARERRRAEPGQAIAAYLATARAA